MKQRVGCVGYVNGLPYAIPLSLNKQIALTCDTPVNLFNLFIKEQLDAVITSSCHSLLSKNISFLPDLGVGSLFAIKSVNFYASPDLLSKKNIIIKLTEESSTSALLLKILCKFYWNISPTFISSDPDIKLISKNCDGFLLIGNQSLLYPKVRNFHTFDLAEEWFKFSGLPFVFALCYVKPEDKELTRYIHDIVSRSLDWSSSHKHILIHSAQQLSGLKTNTLTNYFDLCIYRLSDKHLEGLDKFRQLYETL